MDFGRRVKDRHAIGSASLGALDPRAGGNRMSNDLRLKSERGNFFDGFGHTWRDAWVAGLDHLHADLVEQARDFDLFVNRKIDIGRLLAFTQRCIQNLKHDVSFYEVNDSYRWPSQSQAMSPRRCFGFQNKNALRQRRAF